jgi:hypothetical protein
MYFLMQGLNSAQISSVNDDDDCYYYDDNNNNCGYKYKTWHLKQGTVSVSEGPGVSGLQGSEPKYNQSINQHA